MIKKIIRKIRYELQFKNTNYYVRISEKISKQFYKLVLRKKVLKLSPINVQTANAELTLGILANKKNFYESVAALYSFCFWAGRVNIHYHEDGSLSETEINVLKKTFPGIRFFERNEQNSKVRDHLLSKNLPYCAKLRDSFLFSLRSFDMIIEKQTPFFLQIDSDVLFFSKPIEMLKIVNEKKLNGCYNQDRINAYTFDPAAMANYLPVPVINQFNAGVFMHNFNEDFFDFAEGVLKKEPRAAESWHLEQTLFAMYVTLKGGFLELPTYYDLAKRERNKGKKIISEHYVHNSGFDFHKDFIYKLYPLLITKQ